MYNEIFEKSEQARIVGGKVLNFAVNRSDEMKAPSLSLHCLACQHALLPLMMEKAAGEKLKYRTYCQLMQVTP